MLLLDFIMEIRVYLISARPVHVCKLLGEIIRREKLYPLALVIRTYNYSEEFIFVYDLINILFHIFLHETTVKQ